MVCVYCGPLKIDIHIIIILFHVFKFIYFSGPTDTRVWAHHFASHQVLYSSMWRHNVSSWFLRQELVSLHCIIAKSFLRNYFFRWKLTWCHTAPKISSNYDTGFFCDYVVLVAFGVMLVWQHWILQLLQHKWALGLKEERPPSLEISTYKWCIRELFPQPAAPLKTPAVCLISVLEVSAEQQWSELWLSRKVRWNWFFSPTARPCSISTGGKGPICFGEHRIVLKTFLSLFPPPEGCVRSPPPCRSGPLVWPQVDLCHSRLQARVIVVTREVNKAGLLEIVLIEDTCSVKWHSHTWTELISWWMNVLMTHLAHRGISFCVWIEGKLFQSATFKGPVWNIEPDFYNEFLYL